MTLSNIALPALLLATVALPSAALARPEPKLTASLVERTCEREPACVARLYADMLAAQETTARELRVDAVAVFDRGADRLQSADSARLTSLAESWKADASWATITVEGYADASVRSAADRLALAQQRAEQVKNDLVANGVDPAFVIAVGRDAHSASRSCVDLTISLGTPSDTASIDL